jgi:hypothetical protein
MMTHQEIINVLFGGLGAAIGWMLKVIWDAVQRLNDDVKQIERDLPEVYVRKDDFRTVVVDIKEDFKELKQDMKEGFNKLDSTLYLLSQKLDAKSDKE